MPGRQSTKRFTGLPLMPAATDIAQGTFVKFSSTEWGVLPVKTWTEQPVGFARASAPAGYPIDIIDMPDIKITTLNGSASLAANVFVGVASANKIYLPQIAEVSRASASNVWAIGTTIEPCAPGTEFAYYFKLQQLSGLT